MSHKIYKNTKEEVVPSVTTVISNVLGFNKDILIKWAKSLAFKGIDSDTIKNKSAVIGTSAHYLIESRIKKETINKENLKHLTKEEIIQATNAYKAFVKWEDYWKPDLYLHNELELVSEKHNYGGTIDIICKKDDKIYILDNKTSNSLHIEMIIQLAAYKILFEEHYNEKIYKCGIIKIEKNSIKYGFNLVPDNALEAGREIFLNALRIHQLKDSLIFD